MASSNFSGTYGKNATLELNWGVVSQDKAKNTSKIRLWAVLRTNQYSSFYGITAPLTVHVDGGGAIHNVSLNVGTNASPTIWQSEYTVGHGVDGSKKLNADITLSINGGNYGSAKVSISVDLPKIARLSDVTVSNVVIGSSTSIAITRQDNSYTHTIRYDWYGKTGTAATNATTSASWSLPMDFANDVPSATSGTGTLYVDTYSGSTLLGTRQFTFTASVPDSVKPTLQSLTLTDTNTVVKGLLTGNNFLQVMSNVQVTFNGASGAYDSNITGYKAEIVNKNQSITANGGKLGIMNFSGSATVRATVFDSRGRQSDAKDVTINVIEYFAPILSFSATRTRETPNIIQVVRNAKIAPITLSGSQKNVMTLTFKVAPLNSSSYTTDNGSASGSYTTVASLINSAANLAGNYPANQSFTIIGTLSDKFTSVEFSATVATEKVVVSYDKDGRVGIGKVANDAYKAGSLDVAGDIYAGDKPIQQHRLTTVEGYAVNDFYVDFNNNITSGYYHKANTAPNNPSATWGMLHVVGGGTQLVQYFAERDGSRRLFLRARTNGAWTAWVEYAKTDHTNLINTGWVSANFDGTYYKRVGDILSIRYSFTGTGKTMFIGKVPSDVFTAPQNYMLTIAEWSADGHANTHLQINANQSDFNVLTTKSGAQYAGQITIAI